MAAPNDTRSIPQLLSDLTREVSTLVRQESQLVRAEISEKANQLKRGAGEVAAGGILLFAAVLLILQAGVVALAQAIGLVWSSLVVGLAAGLVGVILLKVGTKTAKPENLKLERTADQAREDARLVKDQVK